MPQPIPSDFALHMESMPGLDHTSLLTALQQDPSVSVRLNRRKSISSPLYADMQPVAWCRSGFYLEERPRFTLNPLLHGGAFYVQEASSMIYEEVAAQLLESLREGHPSAGMAILDLCAAPGGKTTAMINAMANNDIIVANEFVPQRAAVLRENVAKWGFPGAAVTGSAPSVFADSGPVFDIVAVDAPCSGEGMMRRDETARSQWSPSLVRQCSLLQREIMESAVQALKPGGYLIYSTCTFNIEENEQNALFFADTFGLIPVKPDLPDEWGISHQLSGDIPMLRFMPHITRGEGLTMCVFKKKGVFNPSSIPSSPVRKKENRQKKKKTTTVELPPVGEWIEDIDDLALRCNDKTVWVLPSTLDSLLGELKGVRVLAPGIEAAELKGRDFVPVSTLAMCSNFNRSAFPSVEVDEDTAIAYLRHEAITLPSDIEKGYVVITFKGTPLGFVKNIGQRANNLYPSAWKIRISNPSQS